MFKRRTRLLVIACVAGTLAFLVPIGLSAYIAREFGRNNANRFLDSLMTDLLKRATTLRLQSDTVFERLAALDAKDPCSAADLNRMNDAAAALSYLQGLGRMRGNILVCSTLSGNEKVDLGKPDRNFQPRGAPSSHARLAWDDVELPHISHTEFSVLAHEGFAAISLPDLVTDVAMPPGMIVGQFGIADHGIRRAKGAIRKEWMRRFESKAISFEDDNGYWVSMKPSGPGYTVAVAAMPPVLAHAYMRTAARRALPIGISLGALLAFVVFLRARYLLSLKARLREALENKEFFLLYQPVIDLRNNRCVGAEALIRWCPPDEKVVSPVIFIPAAEHYGLIKQVTAQVMEMVASDAAALFRSYPDAHIAINFSAEDLHAPETEHRLQELLIQAGAVSRNILIEATERGLMMPEKAKGAIETVRAQGFRVAIDDFGTGSSSLSYLATYDLDVLKIDKMFVDSIEQNTPTTKIAFHIIKIAQTLDLEMIAEGIETEGQRDALIKANVQYGQGWLFAKPMLITELLDFMHVKNVA
jgi:sensor c-di-GMP phosphodiesterase-like protein